MRCAGHALTPHCQQRWVLLLRCSTAGLGLWQSRRIGRYFLALSVALAKPVALAVSVSVAPLFAWCKLT